MTITNGDSLGPCFDLFDTGVLAVFAWELLPVFLC